MEVSPPLLDILKNKNEKVKLYQYNQSLKIFRVKVFRFIAEFRFLEVLRGHFSKSCNSVEKTFAVNL